MKFGVTGAATGIGAETCRLLKERGNEVYAFDIKQPDKNFDFFHRIDLSDKKAIDEVGAMVHANMIGNASTVYHRSGLV